MTYLDRALARLQPPAAKAAAPGRALAPADPMARYTVPDPASVASQADLYAKLAWVQVAVGHVARTAAGSAFSVLSGDKAQPDHAFVELLRRPNPMQSRFEFLSATFSWILGAGNAYWWLNRPSEALPPAEAWLIPASRIQPVPDGRWGVAGYLYDDGTGQWERLEAWEVVHFKTWNPLNPYVGLSPLMALAVDARADLAAQTFNLNFYGRDNAKISGILAFADAIEDGVWKRMEADLNEQHGGTKQKRIGRIRGAGAGGVQWLPTMLTQVETQYLEQRRFTKEEVYDMLAPGLASVLAVNATEANSTAGKDTFLSMAVYPQQVAVAEKITNDVLPAYGEGLVGSFDDVRRVDTELELKEQMEFAKYHTVDEVRKRYYGEGGIGDERGKLLPAQAATVNPNPPPPAPVIPVDPATAAKRDELRRWRTKATKALHAGRPADVAFDADYLSDDEAMAVRAALKRATTAEDVAAAFRGGEG